MAKFSGFSDIEAFTKKSTGGDKKEFAPKFVGVGWHEATIKTITKGVNAKLDETFKNHTLEFDVGGLKKLAFLSRPTTKLLFGEKNYTSASFECRQFAEAVTGSSVDLADAKKIFEDLLEKGEAVGKRVRINVQYRKTHLVKRDDKKIVIVNRKGEEIEGRGFDSFDDANAYCAANNIALEKYPNVIDYELIEGANVETEDVPF